MNEAKRYKVKEFSFYRVGDDLQPDGEALASIYSDLALAKYHGLFIAQINTLFGEYDENNKLKVSPSYVVAGEDGRGEKVYFEVYYGPYIAGLNTKKSLKAAKELEELIKNTEPLDCELTIPLGENAKVVMGVKDGEPFYETILNGDEPLKKILESIVD